MNAADLARLELAKRAYRAAAPSEAEVQTGVRRARLSLTRPKPRRNWFSKGLVLVVLAVGSLAYAKPHALEQLVDNLRAREAAPGKHPTRAGSLGTAPGEATRSATGPTQLAASVGADHAHSPNADVTPYPNPSPEPPPSPNAPDLDADLALDAAPDGNAPRALRPAPPASKVGVASHGGHSGAKPSVTTPDPSSADAAGDRVTSWGRVGQALARGDDRAALSALSELSTSDDAQTREKADLGRAQLLMAHGDPEQACALARTLSRWHNGGRVERQAQLLLKSCQR